MKKFSLFETEWWDEDDPFPKEKEKDHWDVFNINRHSRYFFLFKYFLIENDVEMKFLNNLNNSKNGSNFHKSWVNIYDYFDTFMPAEWVKQSFSWMNSPEGHYFWENIYNKWREILINIRYEHFLN